MMVTDQEAYESRLRAIPAGWKCIVVLFSIIMCIGVGKISVCCTTLAVMTGLCIYSGTKIRRLAALFSIPMGFILINSLALAMDIGGVRDAFFLAFPLGGKYAGIHKNGVYHAAVTALRALSSVSCMYFLSLTTPMTDLFLFLRRMPLPKFFIEITELIYRYIFILLNTARRMYIAQDARLGFLNLKNAYRSTGTLAANVLIKALKQADRSYIALEARGYTGELPAIIVHSKITVKPILFGLFYMMALVMIGAFC